jgi:hypothetical protein
MFNLSTKNRASFGKEIEIKNSKERPKIKFYFSSGTLPNKRFKRPTKMSSATGKKFLLGGNIHDPLNLMALSNKETDPRKTETILQPKKFEGLTKILLFTQNFQN